MTQHGEVSRGNLLKLKGRRKNSARRHWYGGNIWDANKIIKKKIIENFNALYRSVKWEW